nr:hypothetical protein [Acidipropionibacterium jensenii]
MKKSDTEIMETLEAFDATGSAHSAAVLAGVDAKTVRRYVAARDAGAPVTGPGRRPRMLDAFSPKIEEWVERSGGKVRADVVHERLLALGFAGTERTTRRAVAEVKAAWRAGHRRTYRPWITEPGLWPQFDWGEGPRVPGPEGVLRRTWLFCAWLAWSRFRVVIPVWDQTLATLITCLDATLHRIGGVPTYVLTDNPKTVNTPASRTRGQIRPSQRGRTKLSQPASAAGTVRIRAKMTAALELAALVGAESVDAGLGTAAAAGRFAEDDLAMIVDHHSSGAAAADLVIADETHSAQPGTTSWAGFTTTTSMETTR